VIRLVSFKEATKPVSPAATDYNQGELFHKAMQLYQSRKFPQAGKVFLTLSKLFTEASPQSKASSSAMRANYFKMCARRAEENSAQVKNFLGNALECLKQALENEPYWAEYLESGGKIEIFLHQTFGCEVSFDGKCWSTTCYKVSRALGLPGISPGMTERLECSICGKDPMLCEHVPGEIYDKRLALNVAKDIKCDHVSIVDEPMQRETYVLPEPLTAEKLKQILPKRLAEDIVARRKPLTCKDLLDAIQKNGLHGVSWAR